MKKCTNTYKAYLNYESEFSHHCACWAANHNGWAKMKKANKRIAKRRMNARQTDLYIEQLLNTPAKGRHRISMVKDVRIFVNTIDHAIRLMTDNGVPATAHREEKDGYIEYTVRIPTTAAER